MLVLLFHLLSSFMVLAISLFLGKAVNFDSKKLNNIIGGYGLIGIVLVGIGIYIGMGENLKSYIFITFLGQLVIIGFFLLIFRLLKKDGYSKFINISSICLVIISHLIYIYYIIASFIYY
ncbi:hypothetical protein P4571_02655 [Niallia alba]|uniref:hypothetical protein n=1 Tax=Niallia alba TaxID=2729105 RepID=UPI002E2267E7|nr:hypothetical protein [Niallia alba]